MTAAERPVRNLSAELVRRVTSPLTGRGLGRKLPFVTVAYNFLVSRFVRGTGIRHVLGHTMYLDLSDHGVGLPLYLNGTYEPAETALFRRLLERGMVVLDVGAHVGYYTLIAARDVGPEGRVFAFEPDPANRALLLRNVRANRYENVTVVGAAVSDRRGPIRLYASRRNAGDHRIYDTGDGRNWVDVESVTLDGFLEDHGVSRVDVVKIDVQGAEAAAVRGMEGLIRRNHRLKIIVEFWPAGLRGAGESPEAVLEAFAAHGFQIAVIAGDDGRTEFLHPEAVMDRCRSADYVNLLLERAT